MVERIPVRFAGEGAGEDALTWGQIGLWQAMVNSGQSRTMGGITPLPPSATIEQAAETLRFIMSRHQSLRTRLRLLPDRAARQVCSADGETVLEIVDAGDADPAEVAVEIQEHYQERNFDYEREWPVRMAVVRKDGVLTHAIVVYLHVAIDAGGLTALLGELAARDPVTGAAAAPVTAIPPLAQARSQREPAARRQSAASLRHLDRVLRAVSISRFGPPKRDGDPHYRQLRYRSPATRLALRAIAERDAVDTSPILLAVFAIGLARYTRNNPVMAMLMVNNRFRPGFADSISPLVQISPFLIDVADITIAEAVIRARGGAMSAYKNAYYDPYEQDEVIDRVSADRGEPVDFSCFYNDRRQRDRDERGAGPVPTAELITAALGRASVHFEQEPGLPRRTVYLHVDDPADAIDFTMSVDTRYFDDDEATAILRGMEAVAVEAALDPLASTMISAAVSA